MMEDKILKICSIVAVAGMGISLVAMILLVIDISTQEEMGDIEKPCYDKYSNEIEGVKCRVTIKCGVFAKIIDKDYCYNRNWIEENSK